MHSTPLRFSILSVALLCTACAPATPAPQEPPPIVWTNYADPATGVSLSYPSDFTQETVQDTQIANGDSSYLLKQLRFRKTGEAALISVLKADDRALLYSLTADRALENVTVAGKQLKRFVLNGVGNPTGYVLQEAPSPIVIAFSYISDQDLIDRVVASVQLQPQP